MGGFLCCAGAACCAAVCAPCGAMGVAAKNYSKIGYTFNQVVWMLVAMVLFFCSDTLVKQEWLRHMLPASVVSDDIQGQSDALAIQFAGRMSFVLALFHILIFLICLARNQMAANFHDGCWMAKQILIGGGYIASWWIPTAFFEDFYLPMAKWVSAIFLLYQVILMLNATYKVNERLVSNYVNDPSKCSCVILLFVTLGVVAGDVIWIITSFAAFKCPAAVVCQIVTLVAIVLMFVLQFCKAREDASILTNAMAGLYALYLQWITLSSSPDSECNKNNGKKGSAVLQILLGMAVTIFALFMMSASHPTGDDPKKAEEEAKAAGIAEAQDDEDGHQDPNKREQLLKKHNGVQNKTQNTVDDDEDTDKKNEKNYVFAISKETIMF